MAVSITQDGPPPNFFLEWIYNFICTGEINKDQLSKSDLTDTDLLDLIDKVCNSVNSILLSVYCARS